MKIRNGFVSNSSSSSFVALVKNAKLSEIKCNDDKNYIATGRFLYEGLDLIHINDEYILKFIKLLNSGIITNDELENFNIYELIKEDEEDFTLTKEDLEPNVKYTILAKEVDQNSCLDLNDLFNKYLDGDEYYSYKNLEEKEKKKLIDKMFRERKLERIIK